MSYIAEDSFKSITIIKDRYNGAYSGGAYLAFALKHYQIPDAVYDGDIPCSEFWDSNEPNQYLIGKGRTVIEALCNLYFSKVERELFEFKINEIAKDILIAIRINCDWNCMSCKSYNTDKCKGRKYI